MRMTTNLVITLALSAAAIWAADAKAGAAVYGKACRSCHGADGAPSAAAAKMLKVEMRDLKVAMPSISDADLKKIIVDGKGKMVPTKGLSGADVDNLIAHLRTMKGK